MNRSLTRLAVRAALLFAPLGAQAGRTALAVAAIALGVALGYAVQLINRTAAAEMAQAMRTLAGSADLVVRGPRSGFPEYWFGRIGALPEVEEASPVLEIQANLYGRDETLRLLGLDIFRAARIQPALVLGDAGEGRRDALDFLRPDRVFLSTSAAERLGRKPGQPLQLQAGLARLDLVVAGILPAAGVREPLALMDIAAAQEAFGAIGTVSRIDIRLRPGTDAQAFAARLQSLLPAGVLVERPEAGVARNAQMSRAYRVNLNVLALVALFTGGLLVFSTQMLAAVRRRPEIALLRALGATRAGIVRQLLGESAGIGAAGAVLGIALGHWGAHVILVRYGADLGAGQFRDVTAAPTVDAAALFLFGALGVATALAGTWLAAREAGRAPPAAALRAGDEQEAFAPLERPWPGVAMLAAGAALAFVPPFRGLPVGGYASIALLLLGTLQLMPRISREVFERVSPRRIVPVYLAMEQLRGAPGPIGVSLAAIVASVSLMASMAIMVHSFRQSLEEWLDRMLPAQLYVRAAPAGESGFFSPEEERRIFAVDGVRKADFLRTEPVLLLPDRPPVTLIVRDLHPEEAASVLALVDEGAPPAGDTPPPVWISEAVVDLYGVGKGDVLELPVAGNRARFRVAGVWRDYARQHGAIVIPRRTYAALGGDTRPDSAALWLESGDNVDAVAARLRSALAGLAQPEISSPAQIRGRTLRVFDRTFAVTYALEAVAVVIGLFALSSSFAALALARRREFGMLRHLGMTRSQIGGMLAFEGTLVSALAVAVGLALGWLLSLVLIHVVNRQSFHWSMDLSMPWLALAGFAAFMVALASLTAWLGARSAMSGDAVQAVKDVW